jgi:ribosome biogenesis protein Nip4
VCTIKQIKDFVSRFQTRISLDKNLIVKRRNRYFLLNNSLKRLISKDFFYAGTYLGKTKRGKFFPSFNLLRMITRKKANKVIVDKKTEWLFICGRDIFKKGMTEVTGLKRKGDYTLIVNQHGECLGFGKMLCNLDKAKDAVVIENISDIGDFLRREKKQA